MNLVRQFAEAIRATSKQTTSAYDTSATVTRIEGSTAWVHIPGGVDETPVKLTIDAKPGDTVQVRVGGGKAWLTGNATAPPTDDSMAKHVRAELEKAKDAIFRSIQAVTIMTHRLIVSDDNGNVIANIDADTKTAEVGGWTAADGILSTTVVDPDTPTITRYIALDASTGEVVIEKRQTSNGNVTGDIIISKDEVSFGIYDDGALWYRNSLSVSADGQRGTLEFDSGAPYGGQLGVTNYDGNNATLYTGMTDISDIGDGTITGAIAALAPSASSIEDSAVSVASGTATTVASITLRKGVYILDGAASFTQNSTGYRQLHFSYSDGGSFINRFAGTRVAAASGGMTWVEAMYVATISSDNTTVYLVANQTSGSTLSASTPGIMATALDGGGIYAAG